MMKYRWLFFCVCLVNTPMVMAGVDGFSIALQCTGCHGTDGRSQGKTPDLVGQSASELLAQMKKYGAGRKHPTMMDRVVNSYSWDELEAVADYFSSLDWTADD